MTSEEVLFEVAEQESWDTDTCLQFLLDYIDELEAKGYTPTDYLLSNYLRDRIYLKKVNTK